jgi:hypothetical protein
MEGVERVMKRIPIFSVPQANLLEGYIRFRHTKAYIRNKSALHPSKEIMASIGYRALHKLTVHRREWDELTRRIPVKYLSAIGVDLDVLRFTLELDQQEFDLALELPVFPKSYGVRLMPTVYRTMDFPSKTTEERAILILKDYSKTSQVYCFITVADLKSVWVQPDGAVFTVFYRPELEIDKAWVNASESGSFGHKQESAVMPATLQGA